MKKTYIACVTVLIILLVNWHGHALTTRLNIGGQVWYANWDYYQKDFYSYNIYRYSTLCSRYRMPWAILYGPFVSMDIGKKWSISSVFMYSDQFVMDSRHIATYNPNLQKKQHLEFVKYDFDFLTKYSALPYLAIFAGFKMQGYSNEGRTEHVALTYVARTGMRQQALSPGAGVGLGITIPIYKGLFLLANVSSVYLKKTSERKWKHVLAPFSLTGIYPGLGRSKVYYDALGASSSLSLAYYIEPAHVTISIGFRHQSLYHMMRKIHYRSYYTSSSIQDNIEIIARTRMEIWKSINKEYDHFYGAYFSIVYSVIFKGADSE